MSTISSSKLLNPVLGLLTTAGGGSSQQHWEMKIHSSLKVCSVKQWGPNQGNLHTSKHATLHTAVWAVCTKGSSPALRPTAQKYWIVSVAYRFPSLLLYQSFQIKPIVCKGKTSKRNRKAILTSRDPVVLSRACIHTISYLLNQGLKHCNNWFSVNLERG